MLAQTYYGMGMCVSLPDYGFYSMFIHDLIMLTTNNDDLPHLISSHEYGLRFLLIPMFIHDVIMCVSAVVL